MAARKNRPVLYEVVSHTQSHEPVWKRPPAPAAPRPTEDAPPAPTLRPSPFASPTRGRWFRFSAGRLHLDLGWPGLAATAIVLIFLIVIAFDIGRRTGRAVPPAAAPTDGSVAAPTPSRTTTNAPVTPPRVTPERPRVSDAGDPGRQAHAPESEERESPPRTEEPPAQPEVGKEPRAKFNAQPGYSYVVVQHFPKSQLAAAQAAGTFLNEHGVDCVIVDDADYMLTSTEPLLLQQRDASAKAAAERRCEELKTKIRALGKEYAKDHGYAFEQCYPIVFKK